MRTCFAIYVKKDKYQAWNKHVYYIIRNKNWKLISTSYWDWKDYIVSYCVQKWFTCTCKKLFLILWLQQLYLQHTILKCNSVHMTFTKSWLLSRKLSQLLVSRCNGLYQRQFCICNWNLICTPTTLIRGHMRTKQKLFILAMSINILN